MGYEISGAWGAKMAMPDREVIVFVGDGSYMMMNSDLYSSVLDRTQADRHRLRQRRLRSDPPSAGQPGRGAGYNNLFTDTRHTQLVAGRLRRPRSDRWAARPRRSTTIAELEAAFERARASRAHLRDRAPHELQIDWTEGGTFWEVGVPEVSDRNEVLVAREDMKRNKERQRLV